MKPRICSSRASNRASFCGFLRSLRLENCVKNTWQSAHAGMYLYTIVYTTKYEELPSTGLFDSSTLPLQFSMESGKGKTEKKVTTSKLYSYGASTRQFFYKMSHRLSSLV